MSGFLKLSSAVVLVATAAAEEGIDVPRYLPLFHMTLSSKSRSYVQMRGRCRFSLSRFLVFISSENELRRYQQATKVESDLFKWISDVHLRLSVRNLFWKRRKSKQLIATKPSFRTVKCEEVEEDCVQV